MKKLPFLLGITLLICLASSIGWLFFGQQIFIIKTVECKIKDEPCSNEVLTKIQTELIGKSLFISDFKTAVPNLDVTITRASKKIPSQLHLQVEAKNNSITTTSATPTAIDIEKIQVEIATLLKEAEITYKSIELQPNAGVGIVLFDNEQALLRLEHAELDTKKIITIKKHLRLAEIDTGIVEIDARYQMPVLRTTKSQI